MTLYSQADIDRCLITRKQAEEFRRTADQVMTSTYEGVTITMARKGNIYCVLDESRATKKK